MEFIDIAVETASKSPSYYKHGALLVKNGQVIGTGSNDSRLHAEVRAIQNMYRVLWG